MDEFRDRDHIKSYATRPARMSTRQRDAFERLRARYCVALCEQPVAPGSLFPRPERELVLEIGFGMGAATAELAAARPETNFLGVEVYRPGVGKLLSLIEELRLENIRIVHDDAILALERMIPASSLDGIHLFFPDPWPKKRHHKRRIVRPALTEIMAERLRPGGYLYMVTDWQEYADVALAVLSTTPGLSNAYDGFADPQPWRPSTAFERKGVAAARSIREILFRRTLELSLPCTARM